MVSILLIIDNYIVSRYAIENLLNNCKEQQVEILVVNNSSDERVSKFIESLVANPTYENVVNVGELEEVVFNRAAAYNKLIKEAKGDHICIFNSSTMVGKNWLFDLLNYHSMFERVGGVSIPYFDTKKVYTALLDKGDEIINVWKTKDGSVNGITLFKNDLLNEGNCFNEENETTFLEEFSLKVSRELWQCFYVPGQMATKVLG